MFSDVAKFSTSFSMIRNYIGPWQTESVSRKFENLGKIKTKYKCFILTFLSKAQMAMDWWKNEGRKSRDTLPLNNSMRVRDHRRNNYIEDKLATQIVFQLENFMSFDRNGIQWEHFTWAHILSSDKLGGFKNMHVLSQKRPNTQGMLTGELQNGK